MFGAGRATGSQPVVSPESGPAWRLQGKWLFWGSERLEGAQGILGVGARKAGAKGRGWPFPSNRCHENRSGHSGEGGAQHPGC